MHHVCIRTDGAAPHSLAQIPRTFKYKDANTRRLVQASAAQTSVSVWNKYCNSLETNPMATKAVTSLVGFMLGDMLAQRLESGSILDASRMLHMGMYGLMLDGPIGHLWYQWLDGTVDKSIRNPRSTKAVAIKTAADQLIWAPVMTCVFFAFLKLVEGHAELILPTIQDKVLPTVVANYVIWPAAHVISFKYVPSTQRILYNNVIAIFWNCYLSIQASGGSTMLGIDAGHIDSMAEAASQVQLSYMRDLLESRMPIDVIHAATNSASSPFIESMTHFQAMAATHLK